jgi:hypothetical protein
MKKNITKINKILTKKCIKIDKMEIDNTSRYISKKVKEEVLEKQSYKCNNKDGINGYKCLLWKYEDGNLEKDLYEFDHIEEYGKTKNSNIENIQVLCPNCHSFKTKLFLKNKKLFTSLEIKEGACIMEI